MDKAKDAAKEAAVQRLGGIGAGTAAAPVAAPVIAARPVASGCPGPGDHYLTDVNKGSIRMQSWQRNLNEMYARGYRLAHVLEQDGNTVQVFEHHGH